MERAVARDLENQIHLCHVALQHGESYNFRVNQEMIDSTLFESWILELFTTYKPSVLHEQLKFIVPKDERIKHRLDCYLRTASLKYLLSQARSNNSYN